jgi:hypothetical protein
VPPRDEILRRFFFAAISVGFKSACHYNSVTVCSSFVLRCYANVVIPLKPLWGRAGSVGA